MERVLLILPKNTTRDEFVKETAEIEHAGYSYGVVYYDLENKEESIAKIVRAGIECRFVYWPEENDYDEFILFIQTIFEYVKKPLIRFYMEE